MPFFNKNVNNSNSEPEQNEKEDFASFVKRCKTTSIIDYIYTKKSEKKVFPQDIFEDCISNRNAAFLILMDLLNSHKHTLYFSIFRAEYTHKMADQYNEEKREKSRSGQYENIHARWNQYADEDISQLIATAILSHEEIRDYLISNDNILQKLMGFLTPTDFKLISNYFKATTEAELKEFFINLFRHQMIELYGNDEDLIRKKLSQRLFPEDNSNENTVNQVIDASQENVTKKP